MQLLADDKAVSHGSHSMGVRREVGRLILTRADDRDIVAWGLDCRNRRTLISSSGPRRCVR